jgi:tetratricopeptide repeat protein
MMRLRSFALAIFLSTLQICATAMAGSNRDPIILAKLQEESIPAQDLAAPANSASPAASPAPGDDTSPDTDSGPEDWQPAPAGKAAGAEDDEPAANSSAAAPAAVSTPAEIAPAIDAGSIATTPQISDSSLTPLIETAPTPARAASLRITEQQRIELDQGHTDGAIRELAHAISIDPSNSYAYFYLGRAYVARRDYGQAQTFFKRSETGLGANPAWLGESYAFEGVCLEQAGKSTEAAAAYQKALAASPGNLTARVGATRLSAFMPASASAPVSAPAGDVDQPAPAVPDVPTAPAEAPIPGPPKSAPPPMD